ncbi:TPA: heavy metal-binding domain-containing protein [Clostridioides difficile]|nr:heavy metal-binding domain-containing protein [Clostridioides difficile]
MLIVTTEKVEGKKVSKVLGLVRGSTIRAKHVGKDIGASFKNLVGGELTGYNEMLTEARQIAIGRMVEDAEAKGANAVIAFRLSSASVMQGAAEMLAYGTAVVLEDDNDVVEK